MKKYNVAVVGATGAVGEEIFRVLEELAFPVEKLVPLASSRSLGKSITFNNKEIAVQELTHDIFEDEAKKVSGVEFLAQGTLYPDVIESVSFKGPSHFLQKVWFNTTSLLSKT